MTDHDPDERAEMALAVLTLGAALIALAGVGVGVAWLLWRAVGA